MFATLNRYFILLEPSVILCSVAWRMTHGSFSSPDVGVCGRTEWGNPCPVVLDADPLTAEQMRSLAATWNQESVLIRDLDSAENRVGGPIFRAESRNGNVRPRYDRLHRRLG